MPDLTFRVVDNKNIYDVMKLSKTLSPAQRKCVADNSVSIAEASVNQRNSYHRAIYLDETPIGFLMVYIPDDISIQKGDIEFFLWRFMIASEHQGKGFGSIALEHVYELAKQHGYDYVLTSVERGEASPYDFYVKNGFVENGEIYHGETGLIKYLK